MRPQQATSEGNFCTVCLGCLLKRLMPINHIRCMLSMLIAPLLQNLPYFIGNHFVQTESDSCATSANASSRRSLTGNWDLARNLIDHAIHKCTMGRKTLLQFSSPAHGRVNHQPLDTLMYDLVCRMLLPFTCPIMTESTTTAYERHLTLGEGPPESCLWAPGHLQHQMWHPLGGPGGPMRCSW